MNAKDKILFCTVLTRIAELYGKPLSAEALEIHWNALEKYSLESIRRAVNLHVSNPDNGQFMPKPADILRYIEMSHSAKALYAWDRVVSGMREKGAQSSIDFGDPIIHRVIEEMGGWVALCGIKDDNLPFRAIEFQRRYSIYLIHPMPRAPEYLCGITEHQNSACGYLAHIPKPVVFGKNEAPLKIETFNTEEKDDDR